MNPDLLSLVKIGVCMKFRFLKKFIFSRPFIESKQLPTPISVDRRGRIYYNPDLINDDNIDIAIHLIARGLMQVVLCHADRREHVNYIPNAYWNLASCMATDGILYKSNYSIADSPIYVNHNLFDCDRLLSAEEYAKLLYEKFPPQKDDGKSGSESVKETGMSQEQITSSNAGSSSDGVRREWEVPEETDTLTKLLLHEICKEAFNEMKKYPGTVGGEYDRSLEYYREKERSLLAKVIELVSLVLGKKSGYSYLDYSRESFLSPPDFFIPKSYSPRLSDIHLIIDSSGSMEDKDFKNAISEIYTLLRQLKPERFFVYSGDTKLNSVQQIYRKEKIRLVGGGGTDMGSIIEEIDKKPGQKVIIVITDGYTPWGEKPKSTVIVGLTTENAVPAWAKCVKLF